jgi:short-subunit dehydrogenase
VDYNNKIILITGASSGIGRETAIQFAKKGSNLILVARRKQKLEQLADELKKYKISTLICECDVSNKLQVEKMSKLVLKKFGSIDILVNNAGFAIYGSVVDLSIEEIESQMTTNYFGMIYFTKNFITLMI